MTDRSEEIKSALQYIPAEDRDQWVRVGMGLKSELGNDGFELFEDWSRKSVKYDQQETRSQWDSFSAEGGITIRTVFHDARQHGWSGGATDHDHCVCNGVSPRRAETEPAQDKQPTQETRKKAEALLAQAGPAGADHPYLIRKKVEPVGELLEIDANNAESVLGYRPRADGEPLSGRCLVVTIRNAEGLSSVELIDEVGRKTALRGKGTKTGGYWAAGELPEDDGAGQTVLLGEGVATVLSAQAATGYAVVAALSAGNLPNVTKALRERYSAAEFTVLADLDKTTGKPVPKAIEAARFTNAKLAVPDFGPDRPEDATDFNDLAQAHGPEAVIKAIAGAQHCADGPHDRSGSEQDDWPSPDMTLLRPERGEPPVCPLEDILGEKWASWVRVAADAKGAPVDYVLAALLSVVSSLIGNARWVTPWSGWAEPPILWAMIIGQPSANKSPALDAVVGPLRRIQQECAERDELAYGAWCERSEVAKIALAAWKQQCKKVIKGGEVLPDKPSEADPGPEPHIVRLFVNDVTIERLVELVSLQPRGILSMRDELAGLLGNMTRYSNGGTDQPAWLEAYGGRPYRTERMSRTAYAAYFSVSVLGGIQPDKLSSLLLGADDDGMLARFMPVWPTPAPIKRPDTAPDEDFAVNAFRRLHGIEMVLDEEERPRPCFIPFNEDARELLTELRQWAREQEAHEHGLLVSFIGKCPGFAIRLALVLAYLEWAADKSSTPPPTEITADHFGRACHFVTEYLLPMARRAYAEAAVPPEERAAQALARLIHDEPLAEFSLRDIIRRERQWLRSKSEVEPALEVLMDAGWIRKEDRKPGPKGGRPTTIYRANPGIWRAS
jgi:phage/plasmid primase-like uncharacterized protein